MTVLRMTVLRMAVRGNPPILARRFLLSELFLLGEATR